MSERLTEIYLPGICNSGIADYGRKTVPEMVAELRRYATAIKESAEAILAASDADFTVTTFMGAHVQRDRVILQTGRKP